MVTASDKQQADLQYDKKARTALIIGLLVTLVSLLGMSITWWLHIQFEDEQHMWITAVGVIGGLLSMAAAWRKKTYLSVIIMLVTLYSIAAAYILLFSSSGATMTIIVMLFSVSIIVQIVPSSQIVRATIISLANGVILIFLEHI
jgi:hypothetical protein